MNNRVFDQESFARRCVEDEELQNEIIQGSLPDLERHIAEVEEAYSSGNPEQLERSAHALKGTSGTLSALDLQDSALRIEEKAKRGDLGEETGELVSGLCRQNESLRTLLAELGYRLPER